MAKKKKTEENEIKNQEKKELDVNGFKRILEYFVKHMVYVCKTRNVKENNKIKGSDSAKQDKKKTIVTVNLENFNQEPFTSYTPKEGSKSGQGYNGGSIQETMESEAKVEDSIVEILEKQQKICISVDGTGGFRGGSYLHLVSTDMINKKKDDSQNKVTNETAGTNIIPVFKTINVENINEKTIETVQFVGLEVGPSLNNPTYVFPKLKHTFDDLGLFKDKPTEEQKYNLKTFFEYFLKMREQELMGGLTYKGREQLLTTHNMILTGAPGTGKTWSAKNIAAWIINGKSYLELDGDEKSEFKKRCELVQFHPSYDYTDFVEGLRPVPNENDENTVNNGPEFIRRDGIFKHFCKDAVRSLSNEETKDIPFVFIIDEINRGELSKIFGELFFAIDPGYRGIDGKVTTQYQELITEEDDVFKDGFYVPENVYIIGTMNDIDRSVESMDFAVRRRFAWKEVKAEESAIHMNLTPFAVTKMNAINTAIKAHDLDEAYFIGGAYFR